MKEQSCKSAIWMGEKVSSPKEASRIAPGPKRDPGRKLEVESKGAPKRQIAPSGLEAIKVLIVRF
jgi:hypothetical protein